MRKGIKMKKMGLNAMLRRRPDTIIVGDEVRALSRGGRIEVSSLLAKAAQDASASDHRLVVVEDCPELPAASAIR